MFLKRTISGAAVLAVTMLAIIVSGPLLYLFMMFINLVGMYELYRVFGIEKKPCAAIGYISAVCMESMIFIGKSEWLMPVLAVSFLVLMALFVITYPAYETDEIAYTLFGLIYAGLMLSFIFQTRLSADGAYTVWLIFISAWGCDTCAYLAGRAFGKHKMTPILSPKKTIEGAVGGVAGSAAIGAIYSAVFAGNLTEFKNPMLSCIIICACGAVISMIGDLAASAVKRKFNIKDYGNLIPGHGGIMDRFDSIIFTAPLIYCLVTFLQTI